MAYPSLHDDPDFSRAVLRDLYSYPRKRRALAWALWLTLGWAGAHRFYLGRVFGGAAQLLTGGGFLLWWLWDGLLLDRMVRNVNADQELREVEGRPPRGLETMPSFADLDLDEAPSWVQEWRERGPTRHTFRVVGDLLVLLFATWILGSLVGSIQGALEAAVAVLVLAGLTALGSGPDWLDELPVGRDLQRWSHRLRLFYRYNPPARPLALLVRPLAGLLWAPFRARDRVEVRMYGELGAVFATGFLLVEVVPGILLPALLPGRSVHLSRFLLGWVGQVVSTFFIVYAFATPVGAVLVRYLLLERTHRVPRALALVTLLSLGLGWLTRG